MPKTEPPTDPTTGSAPAGPKPEPEIREQKVRDRRSGKIKTTRVKILRGGHRAATK